MATLPKYIFCEKIGSRFYRNSIQIFIAISLLALFLTAATLEKSNPASHINKLRYLKQAIWRLGETNSKTAAQPDTVILTKGSDESATSSSLSESKYASTTQKYYLTSDLGATCVGGLSNRLFEMISFYGIARSLDRIPYINLLSGCMVGRMKEFKSFFPNLPQAYEMRSFHLTCHKSSDSVTLKRRVSRNSTQFVSFARKCCTYDNVTKLLAYNSTFLQLDTIYLQSFRYFDEYKEDVLKLLQFTDEDIAMAEEIASNASFLGNADHRLCVHTRRSDYVNSPIHQWSTESFTRDAALYLREKLQEAGKNTVVAILGEDRPWAEKLFQNDSWAHVPGKTKRPTTDYAFISRHCQTILITASASTFAWWSAYLSSAENVYYNKDFATGATLKNELTPADFFLPSWIALAQNKTTMEISEVQKL